MELSPKDAELVIGLVARIRVDAQTVVSTITRELELYGYVVEEGRVSSLLKPFSNKFLLAEWPLAERIESHIDACNEMRRDCGNAIMAYLAVAEIISRRGVSGPGVDVQKRRAYIVNQIKRKEESDLLRQIYGEHFVQISCHGHEVKRIDRLTQLITIDHPEDPKSPKWELKARELVGRDEAEEGEDHGQRVRQVFPMSDVVISANTDHDIQHGIERFLRLLFGDKSVTPTREEYGMELANTAGRRSADLSRQVGAAILNDHMEIQALGCNEVPRSGLGTYWEGDDFDARDFTQGLDANKQRRHAVLIDLLQRLDNLGALNRLFLTSDALRSLLSGAGPASIAESQMMDSLEYGRSVHAEMNAITDAARGGHAIRDCTLFSNTFPCHNCAKHIVAAGIRDVIYMHPYPKSYARELFRDSILVGDTPSAPHRVLFRQFIGVFGPVYSRLFTKEKWTEEGGVLKTFSKSGASFVRRTPIPAYTSTEVLILKELKDTFFRAGYTLAV